MLIHVLTIADLRDGLASGKLWPGGERVMPAHRAASYVANPRAMDHDPALLVGMVDEEVGGHLNILSDRLNANGETRRMGWLSAWHAAPEHRETGIGAMLLFKALAVWKQRIGISGFTDDARRVYDATRKFVDVAEFNGAVFEDAANLPDAPCEISDNAPESRFWPAGGQAFGRTREDFAWMAANPWIREAGTACGYPFSAFEERFRCLFVHSADGLFFCLQRGGRLKAKYCFYEDADSAARLLRSSMNQLGADSLEIHDEALAEAIKAQGTFRTSRPVSLTFLLAKPLVRGMADLGVVHPGDGDFAFT